MSSCLEMPHFCYITHLFHLPLASDESISHSLSLSAFFLFLFFLTSFPLSLLLPLFLIISRFFLSAFTKIRVTFSPPLFLLLFLHLFFLRLHFLSSLFSPLFLLSVNHSYPRGNIHPPSLLSSSLALSPLNLLLMNAFIYPHTKTQTCSNCTTATRPSVYHLMFIYVSLMRVWERQNEREKCYQWMNQMFLFFFLLHSVVLHLLLSRIALWITCTLSNSSYVVSVSLVSLFHLTPISLWHKLGTFTCHPFSSHTQLHKTHWVRERKKEKRMRMNWEDRASAGAHICMWGICVMREVENAWAEHFTYGQRERQTAGGGGGSEEDLSSHLKQCIKSEQFTGKIDLVELETLCALLCNPF